MSEINKVIQSILDDLDAKIRQEVQNWWKGIKNQKPESLPWFANGLRGFMRKLYYNNNPDNPDWKGYQTESTKISLSEYVAIKTDLENALFEGAPAGANDVINSLIQRLMPIIHSSLGRVSQAIGSMGGKPEPTPNSDDSHHIPTPSPTPPKSIPPQEIEPEEPNNEPEPPEPEDEEEPEASTVGDLEKEIEPNKPNEPNEPNEPETPEEPTANEPEAGPPDEKDEIFKSLINYSKDQDANGLIRKFKSIGLPVNKVRKRLIIDAKKSEHSPEEVAAALWDLIEYLSTRQDAELSQIGLNKDDLKRAVNMELFKRLAKGSDDLFMGIKISKDLLDPLWDHIRANAFQEQINKYKKMLSENKKESLDIILSRRLDINSKKKFLVEAIKNR